MTELQPSHIADEDIKPMLSSLRNDMNKIISRFNIVEKEVVEYVQKNEKKHRKNEEEHAIMHKNDNRMEEAISKSAQAVEKLSNVLTPENTEIIRDVLQDRKERDGFIAFIKRHWAAIGFIGTAGYVIFDKLYPLIILFAKINP